MKRNALSDHRLKLSLLDQSFQVKHIRSIFWKFNLVLKKQFFRLNVKPSSEKSKYGIKPILEKVSNKFFKSKIHPHVPSRTLAK